MEEGQFFLKLASAGNGIKIWNSLNYTHLATFGLNFAFSFQSIHWSPDFCSLVSVPSEGGKIFLHLIKENSQHHLELQIKEICTAAKFSSLSARCLGIGSKKGTLYLWDIKHKKPIKTFQTQHEITCLQFNWNDSVIATGSTDGTITLHNTRTCHNSAPLYSQGMEAVRSLQYSYLKKSLFGTSSDDGGVRLWDVNTCKIIHHFPSHFSPATDMRFSPVNAFLLASVGLDKKLNLYDIQLKKQIREICCESAITSIDFKEDGCSIAIGSSRGKIYVFDIRSLDSPVFTIDAHKSSVQSLAFQNGVVGAIEKQNSEKSARSSNSDIQETNNTPPLVKESMLKSSKISIGSQVNAFVSERVRQSLTAELFSPLRDGDSMDQSWINRKRSMANKKYSLDMFSPLSERNDDMQKEQRKSEDFKRSPSIPSQEMEVQELKQSICKNDKIEGQDEAITLRHSIEINTEHKISKSSLTDTPPGKMSKVARNSNTGANLAFNIRKIDQPETNGSAVFERLEYQIEQLKQHLMDTVEEYVDIQRKAMFTLHVQMCRQFQKLEDKIDALGRFQ